MDSSIVHIGILNCLLCGPRQQKKNKKKQQNYLREYTPNKLAHTYIFINRFKLNASWDCMAYETIGLDML